MPFKIMLLLVAGLLFCTNTSQAAETPSDDALQGTWWLISGEADGNPLSQAELKDGKLKISGDHYTITMAGDDKFEGTQKLGVQGNLKTIDATVGMKDQPEQHLLGIYQVTGDEFRVIFAPAGEARPTKFETAPNSGQWMHVWKRVQ